MSLRTKNPSKSRCSSRTGDTTTCLRTRCGTESSKRCRARRCTSSNGAGIRRFSRSPTDSPRSRERGWRSRPLRHDHDAERDRHTRHRQPNLALVSLSAPIGLSEWLRVPPAARRRSIGAGMDVTSRDREIHAWVQHRMRWGKLSGPLFGVPFGAKDIIETRDLATEYGSPIFGGRVGAEDADIITELLDRGAVLWGKTQTTAFAYITPAPTRNPRNLNHTPGGSSSGSAAAVAAGMVPLALGTQTKGSVLRPASYCGVTGFKPTFGTFSMRGILPFAKSLDTLGFFTNTPRDMLSLWHALDRRSDEIELSVLGAPDPMPPVEAPMAAAFQKAVGMLQRGGVSIRFVDIAGMLATLADAAHIVMCYEGARFHQQRYEEHGEELGDLAAMVRFGLAIAVSQYDEARQHIDACRQRITELYKATPVILVPAATGPAPAGLTSTGDPSMNAPWTALGTPAISIPMPVARALPLGLQLTAAHGQDGLLLRTAERVSEILREG